MGDGARMIVEKISINKLNPYKNNPRKDLKPGDVEYEKIKKSIETYGYVDPIIWNKQTGNIVGGHQRLKVLKELGMKEIDCVIVDLEEKEERALNIALNKVQGEWDMELLEIELEDIDDIFTGFDMEELEDLFGSDDNEVIEDDFDEEPPENPISKKGDIWLLGRHRLMCGDSTTEDVDKLMDGKRADMVFTDPPYALFGNSTGVTGVTDDKMVRPFFLSIFQQLKKQTKTFGHIYTCCDWHSAFSLQDMAKVSGLTQKNLIIWDKGDGGVGGMYQNCYEMVWFFANSPSKNKTMGSGRTGERVVNGKPNIWRYPRVGTADRDHNAQKPVAMVGYAIENSSDIKQRVLDLFGGSGTTLIACEQTERINYSMELDPKYVDVIVNRYIKYKESDEDVYLERDGVKHRYTEVSKDAD